MEMIHFPLSRTFNKIISLLPTSQAQLSHSIFMSWSSTNTRHKLPTSNVSNIQYQKFICIMFKINNPNLLPMDENNKIMCMANVHCNLLHNHYKQYQSNRQKKRKKKTHTDYQSCNHSNIKYYMKSASYYGNEYVILNNKRMGPT